MHAFVCGHVCVNVEIPRSSNIATTSRSIIKYQRNRYVSTCMHACFQAEGKLEKIILNAYFCIKYLFEFWSYLYLYIMTGFRCQTWEWNCVEVSRIPCNTRLSGPMSACRDPVTHCKQTLI